MTQDDVLDLFRHSGALLDGHFRLSSGLHSDRYLQSALVLQYPEFAEALGAALAARTRHLAADRRAVARARRDRHRPGGGARARRPRAVCRASGRASHAAPRVHAVAVRSRARRRGRHHDRWIDTRDGRRGHRAGAHVLGAAAIIDRGRGRARLNLPLLALVHMEVPAYQPESCPLCARRCLSRNRGPGADGGGIVRTGPALIEPAIGRVEVLYDAHPEGRASSPTAPPTPAGSGRRTAPQSGAPGGCARTD